MTTRQSHEVAYKHFEAGTLEVLHEGGYAVLSTASAPHFGETKRDTLFALLMPDGRTRYRSKREVLSIVAGLRKGAERGTENWDDAFLWPLADGRPVPVEVDYAKAEERVMAHMLADEWDRVARDNANPSFIRQLAERTAKELRGAE